MSRGHSRRRGAYFRGVSNDVSRDLRGCLSVSAKIDLTPHSLHHSACGIGGAPPSSCSHDDDDDDDRCDEAENAGTTSYVPLARASRRSPARLTLGPGSFTLVPTISLKLCVFKDFTTLYRWNARCTDVFEWHTCNARCNLKCCKRYIDNLSGRHGSFADRNHRDARSNYVVDD